MCCYREREECGQAVMFGGVHRGVECQMDPSGTFDFDLVAVFREPGVYVLRAELERLPQGTESFARPMYVVVK